MSMLNLIAALTGGARGFQQERERLNDKNEQRGRQRKVWEREDAVNTALTTAAQPIVGTPVFPTKDDEGNDMPMTAGMQRYVDPRVPGAMTPEQLAQQNQPGAVAGRMAEAVQGLDPERATRLRADAQRGELTGLQIAGARRANTEADKEAQRKKALEEIGTMLARGGIRAIPEMYARYSDGMSAQVIPGQGEAFTVVQLDKDGKEVDRENYANMLGLYRDLVRFVDPGKWMANQQEDAAAADAKAKDDRDFNLRRDVANAKMQEARARTAAAEEERKARAAAVAEQARIPESVRLAYRGMDDRLKQINAAVTNSMATEGWNPEGPGFQQLLAEQRLLEKQSRDLLAPFMPNAGQAPATADPLGLRGQPPGQAAAGAPGAQPVATTPATRPAPSMQAAATQEQVLVSNAQSRQVREQINRMPLQQQRAMFESMSTADLNRFIIARGYPMAAEVLRQRQGQGSQAAPFGMTQFAD